MQLFSSIHIVITALLMLQLSVDSYGFQHQNSFLLSKRIKSKIKGRGHLFHLREKANNEIEDKEKSWEFFTKHHALGEWRGKWVFYDYLGDIIDTTFGSVKLNLNDNEVTHEQCIVEESVKSDCNTCTDWDKVKTIPIATYTPENFLRRNRCLLRSMVSGPSLLRSGIMSTELLLSGNQNKKERVRVIFQHAPVWEKNVEPGSCPPQGLKLFRTMVSHETLFQEDQVDSSTTTPLSPVPPFTWTQPEFYGASMTWGPTTSNRGWFIEQLDEVDQWHTRPTGDTPNVWSLRLLGNRLLINCPKILLSGQMELFRCAWLTDQEDLNISQDDHKWNLLRIEACVTALEQIPSDDPQMVAFYPPTLGSLRCDVFTER